jgi:hypothetical protein
MPSGAAGLTERDGDGIERPLGLKRCPRKRIGSHLSCGQGREYTCLPKESKRANEDIFCMSLLYISIHLPRLAYGMEYEAELSISETNVVGLANVCNKLQRILLS